MAFEGKRRVRHDRKTGERRSDTGPKDPINIGLRHFEALSGSVLLHRYTEDSKK